MNLQKTLSLLRHSNQLKRTPRTGWVQRGVVNPENVAAHTYGVAFTALILAEYVEEPLDTGRLLTLALLHDLPEALTTDLPPSAVQYLPSGLKHQLEQAALHDMLDGHPPSAQLIALWEELRTDESAEAKLIHDADKLDMYLQARFYEEQTGNRHLEEFWTTPHTFHYPPCQQLYDALRAERDK